MKLECLTADALAERLSATETRLSAPTASDDRWFYLLTHNDAPSAVVGFRHSDFDTTLFEAKIGKFSDGQADSTTDYRLIYRFATDDLKQRGYQQLITRINAADFAQMRALEQLNFACVDIGVTLRHRLMPERMPAVPAAPTVNEASDSDIEQLVKSSTLIFKTSHFYVDPFYADERVDELHRRWLHNCHHGGLADRIFVARIDGQPVGYVTCKVKSRVGDIALVGVHPEFHGRGIGRAIMATAMQWFAENAQEIHVRTQAINYGAVNLYESCGFRLYHSDITYSRSLVGS